MAGAWSVRRRHSSSRKTVGDLDLAQHQALAGGEGRDHVDGVFGCAFGAAHGLPVDGHDAFENPYQRRHPSHEAALERLRIQGGQDVAQVIMGGRAGRKGAKPPQQRQLLIAEAGDVGDGLGPGQHGQQEKQQHLGQGVHDLPRLPRIRQILEIAQKNNRLSERSTLSGNIIHPTHPPANQRISTDSALQTLVTHFFTRLPCASRTIPLTSDPKLTYDRRSRRPGSGSGRRTCF